MPTTPTDDGANRTAVAVGGLDDRARRMVRLALRDVEGTVSAVDLAARAAARESGTTVESVPRRSIRRVYLGLVLEYLPELAEAGVVAFDRDANTVDVAGGAARPPGARSTTGADGGRP